MQAFVAITNNPSSGGTIDTKTLDPSASTSPSPVGNSSHPLFGRAAATNLPKTTVEGSARPNSSAVSLNVTWICVIFPANPADGTSFKILNSDCSGEGNAGIGWISCVTSILASAAAISEDVVIHASIIPVCEG